MFNIDWTDHGVEKIGQRKARKEKEHDAADAGLDTPMSKRGSTSTRCSSSSTEKSTITKSTGEKASSLFGFSLKRNRLSSKSSRSKNNIAYDLRIPIPEAGTVTPSLPTASTFCSTTGSGDLMEDKSPKSLAPMDAKYLIGPTDSSKSDLENSQVLLQESMMPSSTQVTTPLTLSALEELMYGPTSRQGLKSCRPWDLAHGLRRELRPVPESELRQIANCARSEVTSSGVRVPADPHTPTSMISFTEDIKRSTLVFTSNEPSPLSNSGIYTPSRPRGTIRSRKTPRNALPQMTKCPIRFLAHNPDLWKAPEEWEATKCADVPRFDLEEQFAAVNRREHESQADLTSVQREIKKMTLLVPASILFRLQERLADSRNPAAYKETEMEKKRLMLFAMDALKNPRQDDRMPKGVRRPTKAAKVLALFEPEATASYLAAIHAESSVTHISPSPLSAIYFPNVRPLVSPILSNSTLSVAANYFVDAYCLSLPTLLPSQDIPSMLRSICQWLLPNGILHMVLLNPMPSASSLGPRMQKWMTDNLLPNLERQSRCTNPRKLIPVWLEEAGFKADDSEITTVKCQLVCPKPDNKRDAEETNQRKGGGRHDSDVLDNGHQSSDLEERITLEVRSTVGRLLWQETWGSFVNASGWWWDDPDCVEECERLGTYWEYSIVEAVKDILRG